MVLLGSKQYAQLQMQAGPESCTLVCEQEFLKEIGRLLAKRWQFVDPKSSYVTRMNGTRKDERIE